MIAEAAKKGVVLKVCTTFQNEQVQVDALQYTAAEIKNYNYMNLICELIFLIDMLLEFIVQYTDEQTNLPVKNISKIGIRYLQNDFIYDLLPLIPFNIIFTFKYSRLFFLIKCIRLLETYDMLDTGAFMRRIKLIF